MDKKDFIHIRIDEGLKKEAIKRAESNYQTLTEYITRLIVKDLKRED